MWTDFAEALGRPTRAYDLIGLGDGPRPPAPFTLAMYGDQLAAEAGDEPVDVIGFSMGALVAQRFTLDHPHRVRRVVLVSGVFDRSPVEREAIMARVAEVRAGRYAESIEPALERWFTPSFAARRPDVVEAVRRRMLSNDVPAYAAAYEVFACGDAELVDAVGRIAAPTLIVTGEDDRRSTPEMARRMAAAMREATCVIMPGLRHLLPLEAPVELAAVVRPFLEAA
jgi:pimeloyl-ACP methyl ester carboxylesterase